MCSLCPWIILIASAITAAITLFPLMTPGSCVACLQQVIAKYLGDVGLEMTLQKDLTSWRLLQSDWLIISGMNNFFPKWNLFQCIWREESTVFIRKLLLCWYCCLYVIFNERDKIIYEKWTSQVLFHWHVWALGQS